VGRSTIPGGSDASPTGRADATGAVQHSSTNPGAAPGATRIPEALAHKGVRSAFDASIPRAVQAEGRGHGVLQADSRALGAFGAAHEALLGGIAEVLSAALDPLTITRVAAVSACGWHGTRHSSSQPPRSLRERGFLNRPRSFVGSDGRSAPRPRSTNRKWFESERTPSGGHAA
jgi:hypothetical protein